MVRVGLAQVGTGVLKTTRQAFEFVELSLPYEFLVNCGDCGMAPATLTDQDGGVIG